MPYTELPNSSFLDFTSWRSGASAPTGGPVVTSFTLNVALILDRANDPSTLLNANWASRQQQLDTLNDNGTLWSTYGADTAKYNQVKAELAGLGIKTVEQVAAEQGVQSGYISSAESRTIWVQVDHTNIDKLFGPGFALHGDFSELALGGQPLAARRLGERARRQGTVVRHDSTSSRCCPIPATARWCPCRRAGRAWATPAPARPTSFPSRSPTSTTISRSPAISGIPPPASRRQTGTIGLVEPGVGATVPKGSFGALLNHYRARAGHQHTGAMDVGCARRRAVSDQHPAAGLQSGRRTLARRRCGHGDQPAEPARAVRRLGLLPAGAQSNAFTAYQSAFWDLANNPSVITSSFGFTSQVTPGSPFYFAAQRALHRCRTAQHHGVQRRRRRRLEQPVRQRPDQCRHQPGQPLCLHGGRHDLQHRRIGAGRLDADRHRLAGDGARSRDGLAAHGRRPDGYAQSVQPHRAPGRGGVEQLLRHRHDHRDAGQPDRLSAQQHGLGRRRSQPARALVPDGVRPRPQDIGSLGAARTRRTGRLGRRRRQHALPGARADHGGAWAPTAGPARRRRCGPRSPRRSTPSSTIRACPTSATPTTSSTSPPPSRPAATTT